MVQEAQPRNCPTGVSAVPGGAYMPSIREEREGNLGEEAEDLRGWRLEPQPKGGCLGEPRGTLVLGKRGLADASVRWMY